MPLTFRSRLTTDQAHTIAARVFAGEEDPATLPATMKDLCGFLLDAIDAWREWAKRAKHLRDRSNPAHDVLQAIDTGVRLAAVEDVIARVRELDLGDHVLRDLLARHALLIRDKQANEAS